MTATGYEGRSLLDEPQHTPGAPAPGYSPPLPQTARALILTLRGGSDVGVQHEGDPWDAPTLFLWGERFVAFSDGRRVRVDAIESAAEVSLEEMLSAVASSGKPVPVQVVGGAPAPVEEHEVSMILWPTSELEDEEKRLAAMDPRGEQEGKDLDEIRRLLEQRRKT